MCFRDVVSSTKEKGKLSMNGAALHGEVPKLNVHLDPLPASAQSSCELERSLLTLSGKNRGGLITGVSTYLRDRDANVESSFTRRLNDMYGAYYLIAADPQAMRQIKAEEIRERCLRYDHDCELNDLALHKYQLTVVAPDRKGILATIAEMLLKRRIGILSSDSITFQTPLSPELGGSGESIKISTVELLLALNDQAHRESLEDLKDGLEYLEHRYHWYVRLEAQRQRRKKDRQAHFLHPSIAEFGQFHLN